MNHFLHSPLHSFVLTVGFSVAVSGSFVAAQTVEPPPTALQDYVNSAEPDFAWKVTRRIDTPAGKLTELRLTSQKWQTVL